jgi:beta-mannosidase
VTRRSIPLDGEWQLRPHLGLEAALAAAGRAGTGGAIHEVHTAADPAGWLPARVPGSIVDDLMRAGEVADVYRERNSRGAEWAAERAWTYRRAFDAGEPLAVDERAWLRFEGIDDAGQVFLDGRRVASHEGMFVPLEVEVTDELRDGGRHALAVVVEPAPPSQPQVGRTSLVRHHKSRMTYGWDFCPRLVHQGLWGPVELVRAGPVRIDDVHVRSSVSDDLTSATVRVRLTLDRAPGASGSAEVEVDGAIGAVVGRVTTSGDAADLELELERPAIWWPNGVGEAALHRVDVRVAGRDGAAVDERSIRIGLRRIERIGNAGAPVGARPWTFVVNRRPMEVKGWNWTPLDVCYGVPRPDRLAHLLDLAAASGATLVRVWGGGLIETDAFYDACDERGLLVWQEFSQSSSGLDDAPARDAAFVERMRREAEAIVPLRRNHPSLAIWCGGNELQDAAGPLEDDRSPVLAALHEVVGRLDPDRIWLPTSPTGPTFGNRLADLRAAPDDQHDVHGPWEHQGLRGQSGLWESGTSLFNGEFGVEGMTTRRAHERLIAPEHRWPADRSNPVYRHLGEWWNNAELVREAFGGRLDDLEALRRASQWLQADGLRTALEANRRRWPRNTGSVPWQLNESFPNAWCTSVVAHDGEAKPAFHAVRRAWGRSFVGAVVPRVLDGTGTLDGALWAWAEDEPPGPGAVAWRVVAAGGGDVLLGGVAPVTLDGRTPVRVGDVAGALPAGDDPLLLDLELTRDGAILATNRYLIGRGSDLAPVLDVGPAAIDVDLVAEGDAWCIRVRHAAGPAALWLVVSDDREAAARGFVELDDNGFDLLPGETRTIRVRWTGAAAEGERRLRIDGWNVEPRVVA